MNAFLLELDRAVGASAMARGLVGFLPKLLSALVILVLFYIGWRVARRASESLIRRVRLDVTAATFLQTVLKTVIMTIGLITALGKVGINTASILTSLGVAGLTIGFAAKDALSNMISGLFIFWDRPFVIGDLIDINGQYGRVDAITMRSTRVVTPDGRMLAVPNSVVVNTTVASYTNLPSLRLDIPFTVGVGEDIGRVRGIAIEVATHLDGVHPDRPADVLVKALGDYNIGLSLRVWIIDESTHIRQRAALTERLFEALRAAGVDMPYETFSLQPISVNPIELTGARAPAA